MDQDGNQKTVSANHATLGLNTDGTKIKDATGLDAGAGVVFGINGSEGADKYGNQNSADLELQLGFSGNVGVEVGPFKVGASGQVLRGIGASFDVENPVNTAPESINNGVLPDQFNYNEQDQTITDWSSWFKDVSYPAENFDPENPGTPSSEGFVGVEEAAGRFTFDTLDAVGKGLIDAGSKLQEVSIETFSELEKAPESIVNGIRNAGNSFIDGIKNPRTLFGSNENEPEK